MLKGQLFAVYLPGKDFDRLLQGEGREVHLREIGHPWTQATARSAETPRALALGTAGVAADDLAHPARRTGGGKRAATMTGQLVLALVPCGGWRDAPTTLAPGAAQGTPWGAPLAGSPEARHPSRPPRALVGLQARRRHALPQVPALAPVGDDGRFPDCPPG